MASMRYVKGAGYNNNNNNNNKIILLRLFSQLQKQWYACRYQTNSLKRLNGNTSTKVISVKLCQSCYTTSELHYKYARAVYAQSKPRMRTCMVNHYSLSWPQLVLVSCGGRE